MIKTKNFLNKNRYGIFFFLVLLLRMLINMPYHIDSSNDPFMYLFYIVDYKTAGLVPRALPGSVLSLFTDKITGALFYGIALVMTLVLLLTASFLVNRVFSREFEGKKALFLIICTFLLLSDENFYLFDTNHFGMIDLYFILLTLVIVCLAEHKALRWLIPLLCLICMAIYEGYVFAFMPTVGIVLLYVCMKEKRPSAGIVLALSCITVLAAFAYFYVLFRADHWNMLRYETSEELETALLQRTDLEISWLISQLYYYTSSMTLFSDGRWNVAEVLYDTDEIRKTCLPTALIFCAITLSVWFRARRYENEKKFKFIWILCMLAPLTAAPFLVFSEQMKYISYFTFAQLILLLYFAGRESSVQKALQRTENIWMQNPSLICIPWGLLMFFRIIW